MFEVQRGIIRAEKAGVKMFQNIVTVTALGICSYVDLRYRKVEKRVAGVYAAAVFAGRLAEGGAGITALFTGLVPGILFLFLSFVTRQGIGYGDSILILILGASVGIETELEILLLVFAFSGIWAVVLLFRKRGNVRQEFPFVPFLLAGTVLEILFV